MRLHEFTPYQQGVCPRRLMIDLDLIESVESVPDQGKTLIRTTSGSLESVSEDFEQVVAAWRG